MQPNLNEWNTTKRIRLLHATEDENEQPLSEVFTASEQRCLEQANQQLNGSSVKQMNPYKPLSLIWARWIIVSLGGWKSYASQRNAGTITLKRGLENFNQMYYGWCLSLKYFEGVGTQ